MTIFSFFLDLGFGSLKIGGNFISRATRDTLFLFGLSDFLVARRNFGSKQKQAFHWCLSPVAALNVIPVAVSCLPRRSFEFYRRRRRRPFYIAYFFHVLWSLPSGYFVVVTCFPRLSPRFDRRRRRRCRSFPSLLDSFPLVSAQW